MTTLTINGAVKSIEKSRGKTLWVALILSGSPIWKIIFKNDFAEKVLRDVAIGDEIIADGTFVTNANDTFKLFANGYMKLENSVTA